MKIRKLQLKNIGVFDDETIEFQPCPAKDKAEIHIFTGQNGSGKTTILMALACRFEYFMRSNVIIPENSHPLPNNFHKRFRESGSVSIISDYFSSGEHFVKTTLIKDKDFLYPIGSQEEQSPSDYWVSARSKGKPFDNEMDFRFAPFAFSGYRHIENEPVQANYLPKVFNPLSQSLEFVKDYREESEITINQLVANNISNRALSKEDDSLEEAKRYEAVIKAIENFVKDVSDYEVKFVLKRSPNELKLKMHGEELDFDLLPDGLRSLISWIADLLGRVDLLKWQDDLPINEKNLILLLDEIEVHLHPAWQRKVLPVVQKLFKNSQIFVSTHSPFVVNSVDDAWVYELDVKDGKAKVREKNLTKTTESVQTTLEEVFEVPQIFGYEVQKDLDRFYELRSKVKNNGGEFDKEFKEIAKRLLKKSEEQNSVELQSIIAFELKQLKYEL